MKRNKYSLSRYIPEKVKSEVRKRSGFGCVICCDAIFTYEHFNPPFKDAKEHNADGITLLCGSHQDRATRNILSKNMIESHDKDPCAKKVGNKAKYIFDHIMDEPEIAIGSNWIVSCGPALIVNDDLVVGVDLPESGSKRWRLSAKFHNKYGDLICEINNNEIIINNNAFDFKSSGKKFTVYGDCGEKILVLDLNEPYGIVIKYLKIINSYGSIVIDDDKLIICNENESFDLNISSISGMRRGIEVNSTGSIRVGDDVYGNHSDDDNYLKIGM